MRFLVRMYRHRNDYSAMVPDLPGCIAAGDSVEHVRDLVTEAIRMHLELMRRSGEKVPTPKRYVDLDLDALEKGEICTWVDVPAPPRALRKKRLVGTRGR